MKRIVFFFLLLLAPAAVRAQGTVNALETDFQGRINLGVEKKITKGLHLGLDAEMRLKDNFGRVGRAQADLNLSWKPLPWLKASLGYIFIGHQSSELEWKMRHRVYVNATAWLDAGDWRFSLREQLQMTHKEVNNPHKHTPNPLELKSRVKAEYRGWKRWHPYAFAELKNCFNDPSWKATWTGSAYTNSSFLGYGSAYINRVRGALGVEWRLSKHHALDFHVMGDYCYEKHISTQNSQQSLKALTWDQALNTSICLGYKFSF